jgi:hypothetical protein
MRLAALLLLALLAATHPIMAQDDESASPHRMLKPNGEVDTEKCAVCHNPDMSLARPRPEVCTLCHSMTTHSGAAEHVQASAASVTALFGGKEQAEPALPLTENGGIFCGTCHLFHDPRVMTNETPLAQAWVPPDTGLPEAVRKSVEAKWPPIAQKYDEKEPGAKFATHGTRMLRLPVADGALCRHCHGTLP